MRQCKISIKKTNSRPESKQEGPDTNHHPAASVSSTPKSATLSPSPDDSFYDTRQNNDGTHLERITQRKPMPRFTHVLPCLVTGLDLPGSGGAISRRIGAIFLS